MKKDSAEHSFADLGVTEHTWTGLVSKEFMAFTPALLYWGTTLDRDVVRDYASRLDKSTRIKLCDAPRPIFNMKDPIREIRIPCGGAVGEKVEKVDLSRRLYFCPRDIWPDLRNTLRGYGFIDLKLGRYAIAAECPLMEVPDYVKMAAGKFPPGSIQVASIGVYASDFCSIWRWNPNNIYQLPEAYKASRVDVVYYDGLMFMEKRL